MCEKVFKVVTWRLNYVHTSLITQEMCGKAVEDGPWHLKHAPDHFKTPEMCEKAVEKTHGGCAVFQIVLRLKRCVKKPLKKFLWA